MGCCSSGPKNTGANNFYEDGDVPTPQAEEEKPPSPPPPMRSASRANLFHSDGDEVKENTSCWGTSSKPKPTKPSKRTTTEAKKKGTTKVTKSAKNTRRPDAREEQDGGNQRGNQRLNQVAPDAMSFYQDPRRIENASSRKKTTQRAPNEASYDTKSVSSAESEDDGKARRKKSTSCFAGFSRKQTVASNFHNQ
ncbi:uncharacterized protein LOC100891073 [Strongylocentrotus purpuratus]|uniref:Uncharacterized protein n=1 Tax=Strongylocentrotus purpuratus TaxID=7668 RepID=A0A7M7GIM9_STRPU|nr:uncharacterized protein LOC100891073 [Strongylocentrotus purpuratus]